MEILNATIKFLAQRVIPFFQLGFPTYIKYRGHFLEII